MGVRVEYESQDAVLAATAGVPLKRIVTGDELPYGVAVAWELADGRQVEMETEELGSGCETCGYGGGVAYRWYLRDA